MKAREGIFSGDNPFEIANSWLEEAVDVEPNDPNAIALATVDADNLPNVRMVLLKEISDSAFVFFTNYESTKGCELSATPKAAFVMHWKSLRRQIRVRGIVERENGVRADEYYKSRSLKSKIGAWASQQSQPLSSRESLLADVARLGVQKGLDPERPPFWGGYQIKPLEIEFWADGAFRLHDRFRWTRDNVCLPWNVTRLNP